MSSRFEINFYHLSNQSVFSTWPKSQDKNLNIWDQKMLPRWAKKPNFIIFKGFLWKNQNIFFLKLSRGGFRGGRGGVRPPPPPTPPLPFIFRSHLLFSIPLKKCKLCPPVTYVYPNILETCLTPNHLSFGGQLFYSPIILS